jgi:hypothetical protein
MGLWSYMNNEERVSRDKMKQSDQWPVISNQKNDKTNRLVMSVGGKDKVSSTEGRVFPSTLATFPSPLVTVN